MNDHGITKENLLFTFPVGLRENPDLAALGDVAAELLAARRSEIELLSLYARIDELPEDLLDILAYDFKVDWWDQNYTLEEKRRTLKTSWQVHKIMGTKAAVETAIRAIYPLSQVEEWFEYGGEPYHFRLSINITSDGGDKVRQRRVLERLNFYKSLRSHNDGVRYFLMPEKSWANAGGIFLGRREVTRKQIIVPELIKPGGAAEALAAGALTGWQVREQATVETPVLKKPGGTAETAAGGGVFKSQERRSVRIRADIPRPGGRTGAKCRAGIYFTYQRQAVRVGT